ncbi:MAG TPA: glutathione S-transferase family protein [Leptolyngbyaceae cyanobacterium]
MARVLYYAQRSPYARKIRILLAEKNLDCEMKATDIMNKSAEFIQISPIGKVPVLVDEDSTTIWDSTLIMEYLDETYPEPSFYPSDRKQRLECRKWEDIGDTLADNAVALWYRKLKGENADPKYQSAIDRLLPVLDEQLTTSTYLLGKNWTAADVSALCALGYYTLRLGEDWQHQYLRLGQWFKNLHQRESVKTTVPVG